MGNKYLLSLGYDDRIDPNTGQITETALVFKLWDFISLDSKYQPHYRVYPLFLQLS